MDEVLRIHQEAIDVFGGSHGVRDAGMLDSALAAPKTLAYGEADAASAEGLLS